MKRIMTLILLTGLCTPLAWAARAPLTEPQLSRELQLLEEGFQPDRIFRLRIAALVASKDEYPLDVQGRIVRLQCWAMPAEWDSEYRAVVAFADQELAIARARKDRITETGLLTCRGFHQQLLGNMDQAKADYQQALVLARRLGDRLQEADILSFRGDMYAYQGELAEGLMELIEAHKRFESLGQDGKAREVLAQIANAYRRMGLYERAEGYFKELEHDYGTLGDQERLVDIRSQQGLLYAEMGEYERALPLMIQAEQLYRSQQKEGLLAWIQIEIATILLNQNKVSEAVSKLQQADAILRSGESSDSVTLGHWQLVMGMAEAAQSNPTKALYYLAQAEPIFVKEKNQRFLARVYEVRARILEQQGQINGALASLKKYVETKHSLERVLREQRSLQMRFEFDLARKELENQALKTKQLLQEAKLKQLQERRHWQYAVVILLLLVMGMLALHQFNRSRKMRRLAMTDDLTGLHNRRQIQAKGQAWFKQAREHGKTLSVLQLDIDHFKQVNDTLGHHMGDKVLAEVASCVAAQLRSLDRVGRNGGEEFLVLLPDTCLDEAVEVAERIRHRVAQLRIDGMPEGQPVHVSIGCAQYSPLDESFGDLVQRADEAMYRAKQAGRNQVMRAE
ncbi:diguanylate cyclase [Aeromonas hydrophila]|nr:diguanylate cyclase [Aeromonas hydrophila]